MKYVHMFLRELKSKEFWIFVGVVVVAMMISLYINPYLRSAKVPIAN